LSFDIVCLICVVVENYGMAEEAAKAVTPNAELLEWPKKDKRRLLHAVYRVGDLDRTIK
jgi:lactoylglutathione lyase